MGNPRKGLKQRRATFRFLLSHQESDAPGTLPLSRSLETFCECSNDLCSYTLVSSLRWSLAYGKMDGDRKEAGGMGKLVIACRADLYVALCCACGCTHECGRLIQHQAWKSGAHVCGDRESARVPTYFIHREGHTALRLGLQSNETHQWSSKSQRCSFHLHLQTVPPIVPCRNSVLLGSPGSKFIFSIKSSLASLIHTLIFSQPFYLPQSRCYTQPWVLVTCLICSTGLSNLRAVASFSLASHHNLPENRVPWC